jgi:hypothetical protein
MLTTILNGMIAFLGFIALVIFKFAAANTRPPSKGESFGLSLVRLVLAYRTYARRTFASAWLWAAAGVWTAFLITYALFVP